MTCKNCGYKFAVGDSSYPVHECPECGFPNRIEDDDNEEELVPA